MNLLTLTETAITLLPTIEKTVVAVEAMAAAHPATGQAKLQLALGIIQPIYDATNPPVPFEQIVSEVTSFITVTVAFYNQINVFVKAAKAA